ncbi:MAG: pseudouridine synthase [candidate division KSB1 bacterium]|nr:pseudouridine synthase [candidate division KSB1 bacterium]MDZ7319240.1 pseudouridine synthase [candidate division KSB1 bacterium]
MFHKPRGVIVSRSDERNRRTVYDCLPHWVYSDGWQPVGRLDRDSRGLLLFTQDGQLLELLTRPHTISKTYDIWLRGRLTAEHLAQLSAGIPSRGEILTVQKIILLGTAGPKTHLQVIIDEGKNRHLRRLFCSLKDPQHGTPLKVIELKRIAIGPIQLDIPSGAWRLLSTGEIDELRMAAEKT